MANKWLATGALLVISGLLASGCGAIATPRPPLPDTPEPYTLVPRPVSQSGEAGAGAAVGQRPTLPPTATPTEVPPTVTPTEPPTATPTLPPTPTPTAAPTETLEAPPALGDPARGEQLFTAGKDAAPACTTCHFVDQDMVLIGPSMVGIASRAAERVPGLSAEEYLRQSILEPNAYLVPNTEANVFAAGNTSLMFQNYADFLTEQDVNDLVAYMLTLD